LLKRTNPYDSGHNQHSTQAETYRPYACEQHPAVSSMWSASSYKSVSSCMQIEQGQRVHEAVRGQLCSTLGHPCSDRVAESVSCRQTRATHGNRRCVWTAAFQAVPTAEHVDSASAPHIHISPCRRTSHPTEQQPHSIHSPRLWAYNGRHRDDRRIASQVGSITSVCADKAKHLLHVITREYEPITGASEITTCTSWMRQ
jgi:hypothetical protein